MLAAQAGDREAFGELYRRYARLVYAVALSRVGPSEAEDVVQEVFVRMLRRVGTVRESTAIGPWLAAAARNEAGSWWRSVLRRRRLHGRVGEAAAGAGRVQRPASTDAAEVLEALRTLPAAYRETLLLRLMEKMPGPEIARRMGMTEGSVRVNLTRGIAMLREALHERGFDWEAGGDGGGGGGGGGRNT